MDIGDLEDLFAMFGRGGARRPGRQSGRPGEGSGAAAGSDRRFTLTIDFVEAAVGGKRRLSLTAEESLDVTIPPGIEDGQVLRLKGKGGAPLPGVPAGDALIEVHVSPHAYFRRVGDDIHVELPVSLAEAVLGARVPVPTVTGPVTMTIPKGSDAGTQLRLRGKGIGRRSTRAGESAREGDQYVTLKIVIGASGDDELAQFLTGWAERHPTDPRRGMS
jgi:DnaJ-class molecular chaperone